MADPDQVLSARYPEHLTDEGEEQGAAAAHEVMVEEERWARAWAARRRRRRRKARPVHFPDNLVSTAKYTWLSFLPRCAGLGVVAFLLKR